MVRRSNPMKRTNKSRRARAPAGPQGRYNNNLPPDQGANPHFTDLTYERHIPIPLFPKRRRCMVRYSEPGASLTSTTGSVASYIFSANGLFDPNISGTGHQPLGFDQMMASYNHYHVMNARCFVEFRNTSATYPVVLATLAASPTPITTSTVLMEEGNYVKTCLTAAGTEGSWKRLEIKMDIAKFGGVDDILDRTDYQGDVASNPTEQSYFILQTFTNDSTTATVYLDVTIEYDVFFTEPRILTSSLLSEVSEQMLLNKKRIEVRKALSLSGIPLARVNLPPSSTDGRLRFDR